MRALVRRLGALRPAEWLPAVALAVAQLVLTLLHVGEHLGLHPHALAARPLDAVAVILLVAAPLPLIWRLRYPAVTLLAVFALTEAYLLHGYEAGPIWLGLLYAFVNSVIQGRRLAALVVLAAGYGAAWLAASQPQLDLTTRVGVLAWLILLAAVGEIIRVRHGIAMMEAARVAEAERVRAEEQRRRAGEERLRIAQDLHDVLAHHISLITVQAGVGLALFDRRPQQARAALAAVKDAGNAALGELREALEILRDPGSDPPTTPAPLLSRPEDFAGLIDAARSAGLIVQAEQPRVGPAGMPTLADQAAFRILQESLTNAVRHAGPGATVEVRTAVQDGHLELSVRDDGRGAAAGLTPGGNGIAGMRERAAALGGTLAVGPWAGGGFAVRLRLPLGHPAGDRRDDDRRDDDRRDDDRRDDERNTAV